MSIWLFMVTMWFADGSSVQVQVPLPDKAQCEFLQKNTLLAQKGLKKPEQVKVQMTCTRKEVI